MSTISCFIEPLGYKIICIIVAKKSFIVDRKFEFKWGNF